MKGFVAMHENETAIPTMLTIDQVAERTGLAKYYIRKLVLNGEIYSLKAGRRYLINYERLIEYLDNKQQESLK